jgi:hypothetical protein
MLEMFPQAVNSMRRKSEELLNPERGQLGVPTFPINEHKARHASFGLPSEQL